MRFQTKTITPFIITLYVSLISLGWAAIKIIAYQTELKVEHILSVESNKILYFFETERKHFLETFQIVENWWKETGTIPSLGLDFPMTIKLTPVVRTAKVSPPFSHIPFTWVLRSANRICYFEGFAQKLLINPRSSQEFALTMSRNIFPHINRYLRSNVEWLVFDGTGTLQGTSSYDSRLVTKFDLSTLSEHFPLTDVERLKLLSNNEAIVKHVSLDEPYLLYFFTFQSEDENRAIIGLLYSLAEGDMALKTFTMLTFAILTLVSILLTTFYYFSTRRMNEYLVHLNDFTRKVSEGDFSLRLEYPETDGFQGLNNQMNQMADALSSMKKLEQKLVVLDRLASLAQLSSGIAHEIKNPLMVLKYSAVFLKKNVTDPAFKDDLDMIEKNADRIEQVVQRLADFSRPTTSEEREVHNLISVFQETLFFLRKAMENNRIEVTFNCHHDYIPVRVQKNALSQVFTNILLNSLEAMPNGGTLTATVDLEQSENAQQRALIKIIDSGYGILPINRDKIFNPFFTTKDKGTGLGLAIAHRIVTDHDGTIEVIPNQPPITETLECLADNPDLPHHPCEGTTVIISLPCEPTVKHRDDH